MKLHRVEVRLGDKVVTLYETEYEGKKFTGTFRECLLLNMGFGTDQAAELRYEMAKLKRKNKKTAEVLKTEGAKTNVV